MTNSYLFSHCLYYFIMRLSIFYFIFVNFYESFDTKVHIEVVLRHVFQVSQWSNTWAVIYHIWSQSINLFHWIIETDSGWIMKINWSGRYQTKVNLTLSEPFCKVSGLEMPQWPSINSTVSLSWQISWEWAQITFGGVHVHICLTLLANIAMVCLKFETSNTQQQVCFRVIMKTKVVIQKIARNLWVYTKNTNVWRDDTLILNQLD